MKSIQPVGRPIPLRYVVLLLALAVGFVGAPRRAAAFGPQSTKLTGTIQTIDYKNKTVTFQPDAHGGSLSLGWTWSTEFLADGKRVKADAFKAGARVKVKYLSPLFGREYATKIELEPTTNPPTG